MTARSIARAPAGGNANVQAAVAPPGRLAIPTRAMTIAINVDGRIGPPEEARVPVLDRGFLYGDSVYEVVRTYGGRVFALREHLDRMDASAAYIGLRLPPRARIEEQVSRTLAAAGNAESYVRVVITRGEGTFGLAPHLGGEPRLIVIVRPLDPPAPELYERGLHLAVARTRRTPPQAQDPAAKTGNYLNSILALREAHAAGADDAILLDLGERVTEASTSNVFFVKNSVVVTAPLPLGLLHGVTRAHAVEAARANGLLVREAPFGPGALADADEVFLTSTLREVVPVTRLSLLEDAEPRPRPVADGRPGPVTRRVHEAFRARAAKAMAG
jgi:branched-chain amino acid aminotransferase